MVPFNMLKSECENRDNKDICNVFFFATKIKGIRGVFIIDIWIFTSVFKKNQNLSHFSFKRTEGFKHNDLHTE